MAILQPMFQAVLFPADGAIDAGLTGGVDNGFAFREGAGSAQEGLDVGGGGVGRRG